MNSGDYAIVVAINTYPAFDALTSPEVDASEFQKWLLSPTGGQLPQGNIAYINSSKFPAAGSVDSAQPTLDDIDKAFMAHVRTAFSTVRHRVGRRLYLFLSGHGITPGRATTPDMDDAALLMANADLLSLGLHLPGHPYAQWFRAAGAFDEIVLLMDCCRDDAASTAPRACPFTPLAGNVNAVKHFYASATQWGREAFEGPVDPATPQRRSFFSFAVLEALNNGICDAQGKLTGNVLAGYVKNRVNGLAAAGGKQRQDPQFLYDPQNDIVLIENVQAASGNVAINLGPGLTGDVQLIGPSLQLIDTHPANATPWKVALQPGFYKLNCGAKSQLFEVPAQKGAINVQFG